MSYTSPGLVSLSDYLQLADNLAARYDRLKALGGEGDETLTTTLSAAITSGTSPAAGGTIGLAAIPADMPRSGTVLVYSSILKWEKIRYRDWSGTTLTVQERGAENTRPSDFANGTTVYLPSSLSRIADAATEVILGTDSVPGVGAEGYQVISDLASGLTTRAATHRGAQLAIRLLSGAIDEINQHIDLRAPAEIRLLGYTAFECFARYYNAADTGALFSCLLPPEFAEFFWNAKGKTLGASVVFPARTALASHNGSAWSAGSEIPRYNDTSDSSVYVQGFSPTRIRARVSVAGSGTAAIGASCEGRDGADGTFFGRATGGGDDGAGADPSTAKRTFSGNLDMSALGNTVELLNASTEDRASKVVTGSSVVTGTWAGQFLLESIEERIRF